MTWLVGQLWPLLLASFLLGAATVLLWGVRRETREVWEDAAAPRPVVPARGDSDSDSLEGTGSTGGDVVPASVTTPAPVDADDPDSPFPVLAAEGPAPWEQEELWSRPARVAARGESRRPKDEWAVAADNWRSWADEATGRGFGGVDDDGAGGGVSARDRDLFAADRELFAGFPGDADQGPEADDGPPHALPVVAPAGGDETMDPMDTPDMTDDEREAAEIRRMREQARRGDTA